MSIQELLQSLPLWVYILDAAVLAVIAFAAAWALAARLRFRKRLEKAAADREAARELILEQYPMRKIVARSTMIEAAADKYGDQLLAHLGIADEWVELLRTRRRIRDIKRVLKFIPEKGLFYVFLAVLEKPKRIHYLTDWLKESGDLLAMRRIALSGKGEDFDGRAALEIFEEYIPQIREMTGDPEWASRYFAVKILLHHDEERSFRAVWNCLHDSHPLVRRTVVFELEPSNRDNFFVELKKIFVDDPVFEVRRVAKQRINLDYADKKLFEMKELDDVQAFHVLDLMNPEFAQDENVALGFLDHKNLELRLSAAYFLQSIDALDRLFLQVDLGDREQLERNYKLLKKSGEIGITSFLRLIPETKNTGSLLIAARLLQEAGPRDQVLALTKAVFAFSEEQKNQADYGEIYDETLAAILKQGTCESFRLLRDELAALRYRADFLKRILPQLPDRADNIVVPLLLEMLQDPEVPERDLLRTTLLRYSDTYFISDVIGILKAERWNYPHLVRMDALKLLAELKKPYCMQHVLENLAILPLDEARTFTTILAEYSGSLFNERVERILESDDAHVRASLIAALPATGIKEFLPPIKAALKDADPEVRIAAVWALHDYQEQRALNNTAEMLRDPVERVRVEVARALGSHGSESSLDRLRDLRFDENEVETVKKAAIRGLGYSETKESVDVLVEKLRDMTGELQEEVVEALAMKHESRGLTRMVEVFKDAEPKVREVMSQAFKRMRTRGEKALIELLQEDIPSLLPLIHEILEENGWVESVIRRMAKRDPKQRREAAALLAKIGTRAAFRGIVLAARDPDEEVRVEVTKALEYLNSSEGAEILHDLENDPDKRVRKYTLWALERLKAKNSD